ncbi:aldehyde dehydrogenase family protein [Nocardioides sp.]|uniref:aldehyde dehydrogenase family protein n=1 Tax=Nocardioides sp. TaxID=35761 RepID=UPI002634CFB5|nr:aldehyde dehydrogenase family protein [Nocardioides sp.]
MTETSTSADLRATAIELAGDGLQLLVGGRLVDSIEGATLPVFDPSTGEEVASVPRAALSDVDAAVTAARAAVKNGWGRLNAKDREAAMRRIAALLDRDREQLALLEALDTGKPIAMSRAVDVPLAIDTFDYYSGWPTKLFGDTIPSGGPDMHVYTRLEPVGVTTQIIPWNFPIFDAAGRIAMGMAAGTPVILKPAEVTPLSAMYLARLVAEADLPEGVVSILPGYGHDAGQRLVEHPGIDAVGFTGSTSVGRKLAATAGSLLKPISLELGGKSPNVLFADCDVEAAIESAVSGIYLNAGQVCSAGSRLLVQDDIYDEVVTALAAKADGMRVGRAFDDGTEMGPVVSAAQLQKVQEYVGYGHEDGRVLTSSGDLPTDGYFAAPTIVADLPRDSRVITEEIFGPVLAVERFSTFDDAVELANGGAYGLASAVWSENGRTATRFAHALEAGTVWVNCFHQYDIAVPWGGVKASGFGRERGKESLGHLTTPKVVWNAL